MECANALCGWRSARAAGAVSPCPRCGGPVIVGQWSGRRPYGQARALRVTGLDPRDIEDLAELGGGNPGIGAEQVLRGFLAGRRIRAIADAGGIR